MVSQVARPRSAYVPLSKVGDGLAGRVRPGPGETVLWLHDYALDASIWSEVWELLSRWRHVGVDLPGHGPSLPPQPGETLPGMARRLNAVADEQEARHVVGLGFGATVALQMAIESPGSFASCVLVSPWLTGSQQDELLSFHRDMITEFQLDGFGAHLRERMLDSPFGPYYNDQMRPELRSSLWRVLGRHGWWELLDGWLLRMLNHAQSPGQMRHIEAMTMVLLGEATNVAEKKSGDLICAAIPGSRTVEILGAGTLCVLEEPQAAYGAIDTHLSAASRLNVGGHT
jgi:pimeloyl-ACP methyl ester carboxylesterase